MVGTGICVLGLAVGILVRPAGHTVATVAAVDTLEPIDIDLGDRISLLFSLVGICEESGI